MTPEQLGRRERAEALIGLMAPALSVILAAGDRLSRIVEREDQEYSPPRPRTGTGPQPAAVRRDDWKPGE